MAEESNEVKPTDKIQIPGSISNLNAALEGLPGAGKIMTELATNAVKEGLIKTVPQSDLEKIPEKIETPKIPLMRDEQQLDNKDDKNDPKGAEKKVEKEKVAVVEDEDDGDPNPIIASFKSKKTDLAFENFGEIQTHIKKSYGIEIKSEKEFGKFLKSTEKWREDSVKLPEMSQKVEQFENIFNEMPAPLLNGIKAYFDGNQNWANEIAKTPKFNFNKAPEDQSTKELVTHYFPNKFKDEDFTAEEKSEALQIAIQASYDKFNADKRELETASATQETLSRNRLEARKNSISSSLTTLKQSFPEIDKAEEKRLSKILESGDIHSLFFNKDGSYKPDAAKRLFLAEYGEGAISQLMKVSAKRAETKTNEEILSRGADKPKPDKGGAPKTEVDEKLIKKVTEITGGLNKKQTY